MPVDDFQNYFFFLEPTVSFASLFPSVINKNNLKWKKKKKLKRKVGCMFSVKEGVKNEKKILEKKVLHDQDFLRLD